MPIENRLVIGTHYVGLIFMAQSLRINGIERPAAYWETIQDRIDTGKAVTVLNHVVKGMKYKEKDITALQATMAWNIVNKMLPSLQAIAINVTDHTTTNVGELLTQAAALGIDSADLFSTPETNALILQEKVDSVSDDSEGGHPPDVDE